MKLYNLYTVISNKSIRKNERFYKRFPRNKAVKGTLVQTNRGYFIDGKNVDAASAELYQSMVKNMSNE